MITGSLLNLAPKICRQGKRVPLPVKWPPANYQILAQKSDRAIEAGLKIIYCVSDKNDRVPDGVDIVAYEPVWAIGTGKAATAQEAEETASAIKSKHPKVSRILYGGSVNPDNIVEFLKMPTIGGVLPGKTSLDPDQFFRMLKNAAE